MAQEKKVPDRKAPDKKNPDKTVQDRKVDPRNIYISGTSRMKPEGPDPDDLGETESGQRIAAVQEVFEQLQKSIKTIGIYRHNTTHYGEYLDRTYRLMTDFLERYDALPLKMETLSIKFMNAVVYQDEANEQNIANRFYRDGVRILIFRRGLAAEELLNWVLIVLTNFRSAEYMHEDIVSLMWKQEFANIEYVVVETFAVGTETDGEAKAEVDQIVNYLYSRLTSQAPDHVKFARISLEDLDIELDDVEAAKGVTIKGSPASAQDKAKVQQQLEEEDENRMMPKLVLILFKVLEEEMDQDLGASIQDVFIQLLDSFLMHEDFRSINQMLRKFKGMERKNLPAGNLARIQQIETTYVAKMGEAERIGRVADILESMSEIKEPQEVFRYLTRLDDQAIMPILGVLERMERPEARRLFCDALASLGKDQMDVFQRRLQSSKANLVRDMLYVIDKLNPPDKLKIIASLLNHPNLAIRLEALSTIGSSNEDSCRAYVLKALGDPETQMRITAARLLPNFDLSHATSTLLAMVQADDFDKKEGKEQMAFYAALAQTNTDEAMAFFREQLRASSLISKKKLSEHKRTMVNGLAMSGSIAAYKLLKAELEAGIKEEEVSQAAERACNRLREKLLGT
jgi:hypothetical protein